MAIFFTEEEFMMLQDARFERKPYFTIWDIIEDPFAGGISAFGAITDNYYLPCMRGVAGSHERGSFDVDVLSINSLGMVQCWKFTFKGYNSLEESIALLTCPKERLYNLSGKSLDQAIGKMLDEPFLRKRYRIFFNNEYYPALIPVRDKMVLLHKALEGLVERGALEEHDLEIVKTTERLAPEWFMNSD